jgi:shikimate kinase/3-dehydroquinate synthase
MSDGIVLVGLPGSGKTSVGRPLAQRLGRHFVDIDDEVRRIGGFTSAQLIERAGERRLRDVERQAVAGAVGVPGAVIATGGGTILDPLNRWVLMDHGVRIRLDAEPEVLADRLRADTTQRPLLGDDVTGGLRRTAVDRAPFYAAFDVAVDANDSLELVVNRAADAATSALTDDWRPLLDLAVERHVPIGPAQARLLMGRGLTQAFLEGAVGARAVYVVDRHAAHAVPGLGADRTYEIDGGEQVKSMAELERLLAWLSGCGVERSDPVVVIGGGTVGDLGGLAAALHRRGVSLVNVPTTWLAQADSAIGGKVAVDLPGAKNGVGTFWPASLIVEDVDGLRTLPVERRRDGIAECLKAGLIGDPLLWQLVEERGKACVSGADEAATYAMTERAVRVKLEIVDRDPFESGERRKLNLGHTIGHALEIESGYTLAHGAAVALGLRAVARIATSRGAQAGLADRIDTVLRDLRFEMSRRFDVAAVIAAIGGDKKREHGVQRWILPMAVGEVVQASDVSDVEVAEALSVISA